MEAFIQKHRQKHLLSQGEVGSFNAVAFNIQLSVPLYA